MCVYNVDHSGTRTIHTVSDCPILDLHAYHSSTILIHNATNGIGSAGLNSHWASTIHIESLKCSGHVTVWSRDAALVIINNIDVAGDLEVTISFSGTLKVLAGSIGGSLTGTCEHTSYGLVQASYGGMDQVHVDTGSTWQT